jgi:transglutaminase-like putative cysteine protease
MAASAATLQTQPRRSLTSELIDLLPGVALALIMSGAVVQSIAIAGWAPGLDVLIPASLPALFVGVIFARLRWLPGWLAHSLSALLALVWAVQMLGPQMDDRLVTWRDQATELIVRSIIWGRVLTSGGRGEDILLFVLALCLLCWALCHATAWMLFRKGWLWRPVLVNAIVILINYTYVSPKPNVQFFIFLTSALVLLVYQNVLAHQAVWASKQIDYPDFMVVRFVWAALLVCGSLVLITAWLPGQVSIDKANATWQLLSRPFKLAREQWEDAFSTITAPPGTGGGSFTARSVTLGGARVLSDQLVMFVSTLEYDYWRAVAFDRYTGTGWQNTTGEVARSVLGAGAPEQARLSLAPNEELPVSDVRGRREVIQVIEMARDRKDDLVTVAGTPRRFSMPVEVEHNIAENNGQQLPIFDDTALVVAPEGLREGQAYTVTSLISKIDVESLRNAGTDYPNWVRERYLQLPDGLSDRVLARTQEIVQGGGADNPYDQAVAIQTYLRSFPYNENIPAPPGGRELVDYFLFDLRQGYCDYYATSMIVMLRSLGVPARLAQGYAGGTYDPVRGRYEVRESIAHSWPEVYFPGIGWERFEPTPASYTSAPIRPLTSADGDAGDNGPLGAGPFPDPSRFEDLDPGLEVDPSTGVGAANTPSATGPDLRGLFTYTGATLAIVTLLAAVIYGRWRLELRGLSGAAATYAGIGLLARWAGYGQDPHLTAHEYGRNLARTLPDHASAITQITEGYIAERYRGKPAESLPGPEAMKSLYQTLIGKIFERPFRPRQE